jgi:hypothetical protein
MARWTDSARTWWLSQPRSPIDQLIGDDQAWDVMAAHEELAEEFLCGLLIPRTLDQDIRHLAVLIHRPPEGMALAMSGREHFIQMPLVAGLGALAAQRIRIRIRLPELSIPVPHGFVCQQDAACSHELFDIPLAQAEAKVEPDAATDDLCREQMARIEAAQW